MKDINGYEQQYAVTSCGKIWSYKNKKFLKPQNTPNGYQAVSLSYQGKVKTFYIHRLVALAYLENTNNFPEVNHINGDKTKNNIQNLEWCDRTANMKHMVEKRKKTGKKVKCVELNQIFASYIEAEQATGVCHSSIGKCCRKQGLTAGGYHWEFYEEVGGEE